MLCIKLLPFLQVLFMSIRCESSLPVVYLPYFSLYKRYNYVNQASLSDFPWVTPKTTTSRDPVSDHFVVDQKWSHTRELTVWINHKPASFLSSSQTAMTDFPTLPLAPTLAWKRYPFRVEPHRIGQTWKYCGNFVSPRICASDPTSSSTLLVGEDPGNEIASSPGQRWLPALHEIMKKHSCFRGFVNAVFTNTLLSYDTCLQVNPLYPFCPLREQIVTDNCV